MAGKPVRSFLKASNNSIMIQEMDLLLNLSEPQQKAARHPAGPLLIIAGAGSGKTLTLTSRVRYLLDQGIAPEKIIAITFTNKAAKEMLERVHRSRTGNALLPFIGTFHSLGARILKEQARRLGRTETFTIFDDEDSLSVIKRLIKAANLDKDHFAPIGISNEFSRFKNEVLDPEDIPRDTPRARTIADLFERYEETLQASNAFDFDDLIEKVVRVFQSDKKILEKYQQRWEHILVDEFQDVNTSQYLLVKMLAHAHRNLFVIGDDAQSIYSFRGSDFRNFLNFEHDWPKATVIKLEQNYRSTQTIIRAASELIKKNILQKPKELWTNNPEGSAISVTAYTDGEAEAEGIADAVMHAIRSGETLEHIAILYRTNAQSRAIEQALIQRDIPYEIFGGLKFYSRKEIKDVVAGLRYAFNPKDHVSLERLQKTFNKSIQQQLIAELPDRADSLSLSELIKFFLTETNYLKYLESHYNNHRERLENISELIEFAESFKNPSDFLEKVALLAGADGRPKVQARAVRLMTMHMAKGLEFPRVFLIGLNEKLIPHERSLFRADDMEEERRLMYVGITRAKQNLHLSFFDLPSRFLSELPPELIEFTQVSQWGSQRRDWDDETVYLE